MCRFNLLECSSYENVLLVHQWAQLYILWVILLYEVKLLGFFYPGGANIVYCPTGYIGVNSSTVRTCLRLELMTKQYDEAATSCQSDGGDLIRIDSAEKYAIFQQFITSELSENQVHNKSCYFKKNPQHNIIFVNCRLNHIFFFISRLFTFSMGNNSLLMSYIYIFQFLCLW